MLRVQRLLLPVIAPSAPRRLLVLSHDIHRREGHKSHPLMPRTPAGAYWHGHSDFGAGSTYSFINLFKNES